MNLVLYRKYRPRRFEDLVGQQHVVQTLQNALETERVGHAYLFVGPRGTGKTTVARLLARYVNCVEGVGLCEQDKLCVNCQALYQGNQPDMVEIDAASNRGIDEIRQLRESVRVSPMQSRYKVFVLDEAHMLTNDAANALLKTLEEPPSHVIFILATTNVEKLPVTIYSRCQRFDFRTLTVEEILGRLQQLISWEGLRVDNDALALLAEAADGSIRDGESMLEQVIAFLGSGASREEVLRLLGLPDPLVVRELGNAVLLNNSSQALELLNDAVSRGTEPSALAVRLASYLRDVLLLSADASLFEIVLRRSGAAYAQGAQEQSGQADQAFLIRLLPKLIDAVEQCKKSPIPQLPLELSILEASLQTSET